MFSQTILDKKFLDNRNAIYIYIYIIYLCKFVYGCIRIFIHNLFIYLFIVFLFFIFLKIFAMVVHVHLVLLTANILSCLEYVFFCTFTRDTFQMAHAFIEYHVNLCYKLRIFKILLCYFLYSSFT